MISTSMADLPKNYDPKTVEPVWYQRWLDAGAFGADPKSAKPPFSIVIPPPNITGVLTLGHVLNNTIQDILARRARMLGHEVLWLPGMDHAGVELRPRWKNICDERKTKPVMTWDEKNSCAASWIGRKNTAESSSNNSNGLGFQRIGHDSATRSTRNTFALSFRFLSIFTRRDSFTGAAV